MGVPKFYRWISERYPCLSETVKELQIPEFDNLYLDMNGIIHTCSHPDDGNAHFRITLEKIFEDVCHYIEFLYRIIKPRKVFFMAIDGVAPRAKMNQQRGRRFRSAREAEECERKAKESGEILPPEKRFDSNCITPGTEFMAKLHEHLKYFVVHKISTDPLWHGRRIYLSGHETPGEGEHKIMDFIRMERSRSGYDQNTRHCLYGLDADLMMLGLATHEPHFSLLREEVKFGGKTSQKRPATPEETTFHLLHLSLFREYLDFEFGTLKGKLPFGYDLEKIIDDWVLMGFLVGNDFIPNLPHLHIRHDALPMLWKSYMDILPSCGGYLNEGGHLNLERFEKYLEELKKFDIEKFTDMYTDLKWLEGKKENKEQRTPSPQKKPLLNLKNQFSNLMEVEDDIGDEILFGAGPGTSSAEEQTSPSDEDSDEIDTFDEEFRLHKRNYYETKLEFEKVTPEVLRDQAEGYVRAIQWILLYYYEGVPSWSWFYPHHYAPYISDIANFKDLEIRFDLGTPFLPFQQLMAVLPALSIDLLPDAYKPLMLNDDSPVIDFYPVNFETDLNDKQQEWEAVVLIPFIEEDRLLKAMKSVEHRLKPEEKARNKHGPCLLYMFTSENSGPYPSPMPNFFPDIGVNFSFVTELFLEDFYVEEGRLKKGLLPEAKLDVYYPGFPTLKHIPHTAYLKKANVKVFQMNSKNENMILQILGSDEDRVRSTMDLEDIANDFLDETVYVGWPHMYQAKVIAISDDETRYVIDEEVSKNKKKGTKAKITKESMTPDDRSLWHREVESITMKYHDRLGIDVGPTFFLIRALPVTGKKYSCEAHGRIILEKQYANMPIPYVLQSTVKNITVHDPSFLEFRTLSELFPLGQAVFMLGSPHYGCQGEVLEVDESESPRVRINVTITDEPNFQMIESRPENYAQQYYQGYAIAQRLGISSHFLSRITGSIYIKKGSPENSEGSVNIGLNLKFTKRNEEVPGYTRMGDNGWTYSEKAMYTIGDYLKQFPTLWETIISQQDNKTDNFYESDIFNNNGITLKEVSDYLKKLPCSNVKAMKTRSDILDEGIVQAIEKEVEKVVESNKKKQKRVKMMVKPHLLFRPIPNEGTLVPDPAVTFFLLDRVVNVRQGYTVPFGLRGTVIGIHKAEKDEDTMYEVVFDEAFQGGIYLRCNGTKAYRVPKTAVINLSHGDRKHQGNTGAAQMREKFSQNSWQTAGPSRNLGARNDGRNKNKWTNGSNNNNNLKGDNTGVTYENSNLSNTQGGYLSGYQGRGDRHQSRQVYNGHVTEKSFESYGHKNKQTSPLENSGGTNRETIKPKMDIKQESFDENQKDVPLQFVTPKVISPGRPQKAQNQPSDSSRAKVTKMFQDGNNSEFAEMWNELQKGSTPKNKATKEPLVDKAAEVLNKHPQDPAILQQTRPTSLDVESLFKEASKSNTEELSSKLKELSVSKAADIEDGIVAYSLKKDSEENQDGSAALKQMLKINTENSGKPPAKETPSYGRQLSVQELFEGAKQKETASTDSIPQVSSNQLHPAQEQKHSAKTSPQKPHQYNNPGWQQGDPRFSNQGRPQSGGMYQNQANVNLPRNPVMQLLQFCKSIGMSEPKYEFSRQMNGTFLCVIFLSNGQRFQGAVTHKQEAAAESAASVALHHLGASFQPPTAIHPLMMMQQRMMPPPNVMSQNMVPPNQHFLSQQPFNSAFRPVQPTGGPNRPQQSFYQPHGANQGIYNWQHKQQDHGKQRQSKPYRDMQPSSTVTQQSTVIDSGGQQSPVKQSSQSNPFVPLQVTKQQKTPQKKKGAVIEDTVNNNTPNKNNVPPPDHTSPPQMSKDNNKQNVRTESKTVIEDKSKSTPNKQTPNKRKSRIAANFGGVN